MRLSTPHAADRLNKRLAQLLGFGTWASCGLIAAGMVLSALSASKRSDAGHLVSAGIVLLIVLPPVRVATMGAWFLFHRDPGFALIAAVVLVIIIASTLLGASAA